MTTTARALLLLLAASLAAGAPPPGWTPPDFCHDLDCPPYEVVETLDDVGLAVELRSYAPGWWVSTRVKGMQYDKATATGFWRLFKYISGWNKEQQKVAMTAPVTVKVTPGQGPACEDDFVVSFFIPFDFQSHPPLPADDAVELRSQQKLDVYVYGFGGFASGSTYVAEAARVIAALEDHGRAFDESYFLTAGYDSPFRLRGRHNEVWIPAKAEAPSSSGVAAA